MDKIQISLEEFINKNIVKSEPIALIKGYMAQELAKIDNMLSEYKANKRDKIIDKILNELD